jgi:cytidylate kinase
MPSKRKLTIAIDGPSASGKSTTAREVALRLGYLYVDTGAMYRALALKSLREGLSEGDAAGLDRFLEHTSLECVGSGRCGVLLDGVDVTEGIRSAEVSRKASEIATIPAVRSWMVSKQQDLARKAGGVVMEGRDIGTVVLPDADLKIYLDASRAQRTYRRWKEETERGSKRSASQVDKDIEARDQRDMTREHSPLEQAPDAIRIDTTELTIVEQVDTVLGEVRRILGTEGAGPTRAGSQKT